MRYFIGSSASSGDMALTMYTVIFTAAMVISGAVARDWNTIGVASAPAAMPTGAMQSSDYSDLMTNQQAPGPVQAQSQAQAPAAQGQSSNGNDPSCAYGYMVKDSQFSMFVQLLNAAPSSSNIVQTLNDPQQTLTIFAPTNDGIKNTLNRLGMNMQSILADPTLTQNILEFHILPNSVSIDNMKNGFSFNTLLPGDNFNESLRVTRSAEGIVKIVGGRSSAIISGSGHNACFDVVYTTNALLVPKSVSSNS